MGATRTQKNTLYSVNIKFKQHIESCYRVQRKKVFGQERVNSAQVVCYEPVDILTDVRAVRLTEKQEKKRKERAQ